MPVVLTAPHVGHVGVVGTVDVDVQSGKMTNTPACKEAILKAAGVLVKKMPPYTPRKTMPAEFIAKDLQPTRTKPLGNPLDIIAALD